MNATVWDHIGKPVTKLFLFKTLCIMLGASKVLTMFLNKSCPQDSMLDYLAIWYYSQQLLLR